MAAHLFTLDGFDKIKSEKGAQMVRVLVAMKSVKRYWVGLPYIKKQPTSGASPTALTIGT